MSDNLEKPQTKITKEQFNEDLENLIEKEQSKWQKDIKNVIKLVRSPEPDDMIDGQATGLSYRMQLLEKNQTYLMMLVKEEKIIKKLKAKRTCAYITGRNLDGTNLSAAEIRNPLIAHQKLSNNQRDLIISGELADYEEAIEIINYAIEFNKEVIKTIDSYMFMVKNRLELFNLFK